MPIFTLLIVEDLATYRELYQYTLSQDSSCVYQVLEAESIAAGLELYRSNIIDGILLDYSLPDGDGLEFLAALNTQNNGSSPPVVMLTGKGDERIAVRAMKLGVQDYLVKGDLTPELLQSKMRMAILQGRDYANENTRLRQQLQQSNEQAELTLQAKNQQMTTIWESMTDAYVTLDREWRIIYTNPTATEVVRQLVGLTHEEFLGKTHWEVFPWTAGNIVEQEYRRAVTEQTAVHFEVLYEPTDTWFDIHAYPSEIGLGIYLQDINERKHNEIDRIQAERERDRFFDLSLDLLAIANFDGYFLRLNPAWEQTLGFTNAELMAQPYLDLVHPDDLAATLATAQGLSRGQMAIRFENRYRCKDGSYRWLSWSARPDDDRDLVYAIAHDITDRKQLEANNNFLTEIQKDLATLIDPAEIMGVVGEKIRCFFGFSILVFSNIDLATDVVENFYNNRDAEILDTGATHRIPDYLSNAHIEKFKTGEIVAIDDVTADPEIADGGAAYLTYQVYSIINVPYLSNGEWKFVMSGSRRDPSHWRTDEKELISELTARIYLRIERARADLALQEKVAELQALLDIVPVGIAIAEDANCDVIRVNGFAQGMLSVTPDTNVSATGSQAESLPYRQYRDGKEISGDQLPMQLASSQGIAIKDFEIQMVRADGFTQDWLVNALPLFNEAGEVRASIAAIADVTKLKQLEAQLHERESQLQLFVKHVPVGLAMLDRDMCYLSASDVWRTDYNLPDGDLVGRCHYDIFPDLPVQWKEVHQRCLAGAIESSEEDLFPRPDGSIDWVRWEARPWYTDTDEVGGIIMFSEIITDLKLRSVALLQSERKFSAIFNQTFQLMGLVSLDGVLLDVNQAALNSIGTQESEIVRKSFWEAPWWHTEQLQQQLKDAIANAASGQFVRYEVEFPNPSGGKTITDFSLKPMFDDVGQVESIVAEAHDITDRKQAQAALEQRNQELDSFVYIVSHDLKAPLRSIANLSEWIEEDLEGSLSVSNQHQMELLRSRVYKMQATIDGLLDYARIGRVDETIESVAVAELLAEVIDSIAPPSTFTIDLPPDLPTLSTRRLSLFQVLANLIANGIKHHDRPDGSIQISCQDRGNCYEFAIADDGPGIAPEHHDRMFKIFQAVNPQNRSDSTGIGLAIVKKIIEAEGGTIWLESELGQGTTFYFTWLRL